MVDGQEETDLRNVETHLARSIDWRLMRTVRQHPPNISSMPSVTLKDLQVLRHLIFKDPR